MRFTLLKKDTVTAARRGRIETPHGMTQPEIRVMYLWQRELKPVMSLIRMGRGKMMGVDHNKNMDWVGSSAALISG